MSCFERMRIFSNGNGPCTSVKPASDQMEDGEIYKDFVDAVATRRNFGGIIDKFSGLPVGQISLYMDHCIDEEAIDALVSLGGDPSCFRVWFIYNYIDRSRTLVRRLYHGADNILDIIVEDGYRTLTTIFTTRMTNQMEKNSCRNAKYGRIENEKFEYFLKHFPRKFNMDGDGRIVERENGLKELVFPTTKENECITLPRSGRKLIYHRISGDREDDVIDWFSCEGAFGEYHRVHKKDIVKKARAEARKRKRDAVN